MLTHTPHTHSKIEKKPTGTNTHTLKIWVQNKRKKKNILKKLVYLRLKACGTSDK